MNPRERELIDGLSCPDGGVIEVLSNIKGDLLLLGAGGKTGHGLALMAKRALEQAGSTHKAIAVSRFSSAGSRDIFEADGIDTIACDLVDDAAVRDLPDASDIVYLAGQKFSTTGNSGTTWLLNCYLPGVVAQRWPDARFAVYSSGNVYPFSNATTHGPREGDPVDPVGEYAQSVLGRERVFEYFSEANQTTKVMNRLNYANETRYGVLVDLGQKILAGEPIDVTQGYVNLIWQGDSNLVTFRCLSMASCPPAILNLAGPDVLAVRDLATKLAATLGRDACFVGEESDTALISDGSACWERFGGPSVDVDEMIERIVDWLMAGGPTLNKPTHFEVRDGKF